MYLSYLQFKFNLSSAERENATLTQKKATKETVDEVNRKRESADYIKVFSKWSSNRPFIEQFLSSLNIN